MFSFQFQFSEEIESPEHLTLHPFLEQHTESSFSMNEASYLQKYSLWFKLWIAHISFCKHLKILKDHHAMCQKQRNKEKIKEQFRRKKKITFMWYEIWGHNRRKLKVQKTFRSTFSAVEREETTITQDENIYYFNHLRIPHLVSQIITDRHIPIWIWKTLSQNIGFVLFFLITAWDQLWITSQYVQYQWQDMFHKCPKSRTKHHYWTGNECFGWAGPEENTINYTLAYQLRAVRGCLFKWLPYH